MKSHIPDIRFKDCWKRLDRADAHRNTFHEVWNGVIDENSHTLSVKVDDDGAGLFRAVLLRPMKDDLALTLGEFFYQLRAALDGAVYCAAVIYNGGKAPANEGQWEFPILTVLDSDTRRKFSRNVGKFRDELRNWIELIQPYNTLPQHLNDIRGALRILHDCARKDRHRRLHVVIGMPGRVSGIISVPPPARVLYCRPLPGNMLENECDFLEFRIANYVPGMPVNYDTEFTVQVAVDEIPDMRGEELGGLLQVIQQTVATVIEGIEKRVDK